MNFEIMIRPLMTAIAIVAYFVILAFVNSAVSKYVIRQEFLKKRIVYIKKSFAFLFFSILFLAVTFIWGIDIRGILIFASSFVAVVGIALFASWSVLSNITSGIIIFFSFPHKIGDQIRIIDGDNSVEGEIIDMTLFHIQIMDEGHQVTSYPNSLAIQRPIARLKKNS